ncbi:lipocalin-like domain-containing protein [Marinobacter sp.]|uniref:lipocalin-like domain-containing protein n=1 Tax=Marinobacter sp. TaxID=50741 RepID=UPI0034A35E6A
MKVAVMAAGWLVFAAWVLSGCSDSRENSGFAGLGGEQGDFAQPEPGDRLSFPDDLGPHPRHRIEWWYLTANLTTTEGEPIGLQWTQFRQALKARVPDGAVPQSGGWPLEAGWMAHAAVSFQGDHWFAEKLARGGIGQAGAISAPLDVWLDDWRLHQDDDHWRLRANGDDWAYDLTLVNQGEPIAHGNQGFSAKSGSGEGSMYFSLVDIAILGSLTIGETTYQVSGQGWFDREWSSQFLKAGQQGWDWFSLHLDSGDKLMVFRLRQSDGDYLSGTWINPERNPVALEPEQLEVTADHQRETARGEVPVRWRIRVPSRGVDLTVEAPEGEYWNLGRFPYWESPVSVTGSHRGEGYMELTGY